MGSWRPRMRGWGAGEGASDGADDRFGAVPAADLGPGAVTDSGPIALVHGFNDQTLDAGDIRPVLQPLPGLVRVGGHRAQGPRGGQCAGREEDLQASAALGVGQRQQLGAVDLQGVEGDEERWGLRGERGSGAAAGGGRHPPGSPPCLSGNFTVTLSRNLEGGNSVKTSPRIRTHSAAPPPLRKGISNSRALAVLLSALSVIAVTILGTPPAHARADSVYNKAIKNLTTGKCVDLPGFGAPGLQPVTQYDCRPGAGDNQMFDLVDGVDGFLIRSVKSPGLCLDFPNLGAPTSADKVSLYYCQNTTADNQLWYSVWNDAGTAFQLISAKTYSGQRMCLDVDGFALAVNDLRLGAYPCSASLSDDHWWKFL